MIFGNLRVQEIKGGLILVVDLYNVSILTIGLNIYIDIYNIQIKSSYGT